MYKICKVCVMDTTDPDITFNSKGQCNHCESYLREVPKLPFNKKKSKEEINKIISRIKSFRKGKYDCVIGLSGGVDSTYLAYIVKKKLGLNPIAVHMDNGWNSEKSVKNIKNIVTKLDIDLYTKVLDWEEFKKLQIAFLKASTPDSEIPSDHAILGTLYEVANKFNIKYIISGANQKTERIMPTAWSNGHFDSVYLKSIYKTFFKSKLKNFPIFTSLKKIYYKYFKRIKFLQIFNYYEFDAKNVKRIIEKELNWLDYGGKHYESTYTKFYQGFLLIEKFGFDKRRAHLSNLICAKLISRSKALNLLKEPPIINENIYELQKYISKKFNLSNDELKEIIKNPAKKYSDYPNMYNTRWYKYSRRFLKPIYRFFFPVKDNEK